jgi:hypothetical protein
MRQLRAGAGGRTGGVMKHLFLMILMTYITTIFACYFFENAWFMLLLLFNLVLLSAVKRELDKDEKGDKK